MCGEQSPTVTLSWAKAGSPPRVRGTAAVAEAAGQLGRITPACAGNRGIQRPDHVLHGDHPRVCGEQAVMATTLITQLGSPPRVRGTVAHRDLELGKGGITPACAGNSRRCRGGGPAGQDHPRVCGEQGNPAPRSCPPRGSPPRVRGTGFPKTQRAGHARITPACAGNRPFPSFSASNIKDHPRVCGEQVLS